MVVTQNMIACRLDKYFADPLKFLPERWIEQKKSFNPYLVLPFGHGMRSCIARRLAEQNMLVFLLRVCIRHIGYQFRRTYLTFVSVFRTMYILFNDKLIMD